MQAALATVQTAPSSRLDTPLSFALLYALSGYKVIPVRGKIPLVEHGAHDASADENTIRAWWKRWPDANIGMVLDGLVCVDIDPRNGGDVDNLPHTLPETCYQKTGGGGWHYLFRAEPGVKYPSTLGPGIDVKSGPGAYIVVEPSIHASGEKYVWLDETEPWTTKPAPAPDWLSRIADLPTRAASVSAVSGAVPEGGRNQHLTSLAGTMRRRGMSLPAILAALRTDNAEKCNPPLADSEVVAIAKSVSRYAPEATRVGPEIITARDLMALEFKPVSYLVDGLLPEGAYLLAGRPKIGKSWLALQIAIDVARGVDCMARKTQQGDVLYLGLEDNQRRMQSRLRMLAPITAMPNSFECALWWHRLNDGGIDDLLAWTTRVPQPRLIVVDTIAKVRAAKGKGDDPYATDYAVGEALKKVSDSIPGLTILAVTHVRKAEAEDVLDRISGTLGLSGAFDGAAVLDRKRGDAEGTLKIVGRDLEHDIELGVSWESELTRWRIVGGAEEVRVSGEQRRILACLREAKEALLPRELAEETGLPRGSVRHLVRKMHAAGMLKRIEGASRQHKYSV